MKPKPEKRAQELVQFARREYDAQKDLLQPDESINLVCMIGGVKYDVYVMGVEGDFVWVNSQTEEGDFLGIIASVEQVSFATIVYNKESDKPPREIGFHAIKQCQEK
jgi:hypothetical protein